ncbi:MAG: Holliday junction branch migration protein RuvA [Lachnospiraceae bacterium]|nr:Holliday junction branch migration protein RuvA [Lachnospiraceae bacterium]
MIAYVSGRVAEKNLNEVIIEVGGIGYQIKASQYTLESLPMAGEEAKVFTYLHVREDAMELFGFATKEERSLFLMLLNVSGIGPKGALSILSTVPIQEFRLAVISGDSKVIGKAPGIGPKTAQRVIIDLKDKIGSDDIFGSMEDNDAGGSMDAGALPSAAQDAIEALVALGYGLSESTHAVRKAGATEGMDTGLIIKEALKHF